MEKNLDKKKMPRQLEGTVVSDKMDKSIVVEVERIKAHPVYKKRYYVSLKVKAHDLNNKAKVGNVVLIEQCRPLSKDKHYRLKKILAK
ncbi:MAG: 30S ribosomal protein S17 [Patescibacteria group bacterium]|nr:30S ribosomal protein S17 [Patescibacteria group bacterium]